MITNLPFPPGSTLVAYLRDSGGIEQEASTDQQEQVIRSWCFEQGFILSRVFKDAASPGSSTVDRKQFQDMISHFHAGAQEAGLVVWKFSRFARSIDDAQFYRADLRRRGYEIYSIKDTIPSGPEGRFFEAAIDWMNERFIKDLSVDIQRGLESNRRLHRCMAGTPPVGYKAERIQISVHRDGAPRCASRWVPEEETAPLVRQAFELRLAGHTYKSINDQLRLVSSVNSLGYIFRNPIYIGSLRVNGELQPDFSEPIVDQAVWQAVQEINHKISGAWSHPRRRSSRFLLSGLATCGICGRHLSGYTMHNKGVAYDYYRCNGVYICTPQFAAPKAMLEQTVIEQIQSYLQDPALPSQFMTEYKKMKRFKTDNETFQKRFTKELAAVERKINRIVAAIADGGHSQALLGELGRLEQQKNELRTRLAEITTTSAEPTLDKLRLEIENAARILQSGDFQKIRMLLINLIGSLALVRENKTIYGRLVLFMPMSEDSPQNISIHLNFTLNLRRTPRSVSTHIDRL